MGSRGSVIPFFMETAQSGKLTITDKRMTRFMISLEQGVELVWHAFNDMEGGEIYVKKIPSMNICDIATAVDANAEQVEIGIRPGEKLHEQMIGVEDAHFTYEYPEHFKILPQICEWAPFESMIKGGIGVPEGFSYTSDNNKEWMTIPQLQEWIEKNRVKIGSI
jgi:FlaA1/EpsC-like NDP-sugar epimerase